MDRRKVVLTGLGVVSSVGLGAQPFWEALLAGRSGIRPIAGFEVADMSCRIAGQVHEFDPLTWLDKKSARRLDPVTQYAVAAGDMALADSGLRIPDFDPFRIGVILGTGIGGLHEIEEQARTLFDRGPGRVSPFFVPKLMANAASGELSIRYGARGPNFTTVSACASAAHAIYASLRVIQYGEADVVFTGGSEVAVTRLGLAGFCALRALSTRNAVLADSSSSVQNIADASATVETGSNNGDSDAAAVGYILFVIIMSFSLLQMRWFRMGEEAGDS